MGNCTNRSTELPWAHHLGHCSPMFSWDPVKKLLSVKAKCLNSTRDTLMIRLAICWTQHQRLLFFRSWTTATLQLISLRKRKTMACFFFWECIVWTQHHKSRPKFTSNLPTRDFCSTTTAMLLCAINVGCWKRCLIVHIAYRLAGSISLLNVTDWDESFSCLNIRNVLSLVPSGILLLQRQKTSHRKLPPQRAPQFV